MACVHRAAVLGLILLGTVHSSCIQLCFSISLMSDIQRLWAASCEIHQKLAFPSPELCFVHSLRVRFLAVLSYELSLAIMWNNAGKRSAHVWCQGLAPKQA